MNINNVSQKDTAGSWWPSGWCSYCGGELNIEVIDYTATGTPIMRVEHECVYIGGDVVSQESGNASP